MINFILTGFYIGKIRYAPGTFGTLLAIPIYLLLLQYDTHLKNNIRFDIIYSFFISFAIFVCKKVF